MSGPRFAPGDRVRVLDLERRGHMRTPTYIRAKVGTVTGWCGAFLNPEDLAYGRTSGPVVHNYRVEFEQTQVWPGYRGSAADRLHIEIYEHWLEKA
jgi:nitrile hydratase